MLSKLAAPFGSRMGRVLALAIVASLVVGVACSSGSDINQEDLDAAKNLAVAQSELSSAKADLTSAQGAASAAESAAAAAASELTTTKSSLGSAQSQVTSLTTQLGTAGQAAPPVTVSVISAGQSVPAPAGSAPTGWANDESVRGGLFLVTQFDSSGPDAWSAAEHPLIYMSSEGTESSNPAADADAAYFGGFHMVDAYTHDVIGSVLFTEVEDGGVTKPVSSFPHGADVSPDGKWAYVGFGAGNNDTGGRLGYLAIVNMRTLKIDKLLRQESYFEGGMRSQRVHHVQAWNDPDGNPKVIVQWGFGANGGPHHILDPNDDNRVWKSITYDDIMPMGHPFTTPSPDGQYVYVSIGANWIRSNHSPAAGIAKFDITTGKHEVIEGVGHHPIGITHTADGRFTYVVDGHSSSVYKIDNEINEVVGSTSAGVAGPYGIALNWDETRAVLVGKGEGSHNLGGVLGLLDTVGMRQARDLHQMPIQLGGSASSVDHAILHPDPEVNQFWISNMNGWETIVVDIDTWTAVDWIPTPNGGNTHSGAFVSYNADWTGTLESDQGGPKSAEMWANVRTAVANSAAALAR
ncbi:MAG: hypothetical protein HQ478_12410 [Chloroflexi bacterium]|nr:hypothetical protein [Chloroflexota bacterium]